MSNVIASEVLVAGLRTEFADTYLKQKRESDARLGQIMDLAITSDKREEIFGYFKAAPHAEWWQRGKAIPEGGMASVQFRVLNLNWGRRVKWHADDRADDMTGSLMDAARMAGRSFSALPERFFIDLITGGTTTLPAAPLAPDGVAMFSATDGAGAARFNSTGGNIVTGAGVADPADIRGDVFQAIERMKDFKDDWSQPLLDDQATDSGVIVVFSAALQQEFEEAFLLKRVGEVYGSDTAAATPTNIFHDASRNVTLWGTQRVTGNSYYVFLKNPPKKACFLQTREGLSEKFATMDNSDHGRDTDEEYIQWKWRGTGAISLPYGAVKVSNT